MQHVLQSIGWFSHPDVQIKNTMCVVSELKIAVLGFADGGKMPRVNAATCV